MCVCVCVHGRPLRGSGKAQLSEEVPGTWLTLPESRRSGAMVRSLGMEQTGLCSEMRPQAFVQSVKLP